MPWHVRLRKVPSMNSIPYCYGQEGKTLGLSRSRTMEVSLAHNRRKLFYRPIAETFSIGPGICSSSHVAYANASLADKASLWRLELQIVHRLRAVNKYSLQEVELDDSETGGQRSTPKFISKSRTAGDGM